MISKRSHFFHANCNFSSHQRAQKVEHENFLFYSKQQFFELLFQSTTYESHH